MIIYRYLTKDELEILQSGKGRQLSDELSQINLENSKKYRNDAKYLHFFKNLKDLPKVQEIEKGSDRKYIGVFDLPLRLAITGDGVGKYCDKAKVDIAPIKEIAIVSKFLKASNFIDYVLDEHLNMSVEDVVQYFAEKGHQFGE